MFKKLTFLLILTVLGSPAWSLRIVSLLPSNTEILESLGAGDAVVGVSRYDDRLKKKPPVESIGDLMQPNMEKIVSLHPDLIVAGLWTSSHIVPRLRNMKYTVLEIRNPDSMNELYDSIRELAVASQCPPEAAEKVIADMKRRLEALDKRASALPRHLPTYIEIDRPYWTIGGHDFLTEAFARVGADNIFSDLRRQAAQVSPEIILERNPELILSMQTPRSEIAGRTGWKAMRAVRNGYIIDEIPESDLSHPSPRLLNGLEALMKRIESLESL